MIRRAAALTLDALRAVWWLLHDLVQTAIPALAGVAVGASLTVVTITAIEVRQAPPEPPPARVTVEVITVDHDWRKAVVACVPSLPPGELREEHTTTVPRLPDTGLHVPPLTDGCPDLVVGGRDIQGSR